jgi:polyhydroxyalkanoate synthesis regulator phasin
MSLEPQRLRSLERRLREVLGEENASTLMDHLPDSAVATKSDMSVLKSDMSGLKSDMSVLKSDMSGLKSEVSGLKSEVSALEERVDFKLESLEHRLMAAFRSELMHQTRTFFIGMVGSMATVGALAVTAAKLG